ncbi:MAG: metal-dependent transcriptional regulator [Candidatus Woesearchaeota archaeon]|jgi:DtxR family Mn-dependent transcriptional regulator|nr:metal-dependent transcriptional regulator [Candidatus Woesearchaeota archaeon]|tara:strand:+ start:218 stop:589 length:372 start_codon:yes stop_codon:yes gene_type:complete
MNNLSQSLEDYLETISIIKKEGDIVRTKELAKRLNVTLPSVTEAVKNLATKGLVTYKRYSNIELTTKGQKIADQVYKRHEALVKFFTNVLKINKETAMQDACKIEHSLSKESYDKLIKFLKDY